MYGLRPGMKVILCEDEISTGEGMIKIVRALRKAKVEIIAIACFIEVVNFSGVEKIFKATGLKPISLVKIQLD